MARLIDLTGKKFGRLTVIERAGTIGHEPTWLCRCSCSNANEVVVIGSELRKGNTTSCGCYAREVSRETALKHLAGKNKTHGMTGTHIYQEWSGMKRRCHNPKDRSYPRYGGRGIAVCDRWKNSFEMFYADVSSLPNFGEEGYSLHRIDNDGDYDPNNVKWASSKEQSNCRRSNHIVTLNGNEYTISQLSEKYNMNYKKLWKRIRRGWDVESAVNTP